MKKYHITTFGCQANVRDSEEIAGILEALDLYETKNSEEADVWIVNTCSVRQKSEDKVYGLGKRVLKIRRGRSVNNKVKTGDGAQERADLKVIIAGCMVGSVTGERQRYEFEELRRKTKWADWYINPSQIRELPQILSQLGVVDEWLAKAVGLGSEQGIVPAKRTESFAPGTNAVPNKKHAFVNISVGCDNFCTFCVVPYARGKEVSRSKEEILSEINHLVKRGYEEVTLCGQNVNSWGLPTEIKFAIRAGSDEKLPFAELLREVCAIEPLKKVSFISSNPFDFTTDLIDALKHPKVSRYLHMALQSGSNEVLKRMNRRHTVEDFDHLVSQIRAAVPDIEFGTDLIVGFPGETEEDFEQTLLFCEKTGFSVAYISIYSPRKGTPAERFFKDDVPTGEKRRRHAVLSEVIDRSRVGVHN